ncbi:MAG: hypothetical protein J6X55_11765 [Victivallales bacterium]|nr:hypothetical protein [Victivallales bacterium]
MALEDNVFSYRTGLNWLVQRHCLLHGGDGVTRVFRCENGGIWRVADGKLDCDFASEILAAHDDNVKQDRCMKKDLKRGISMVEIAGTKYVVKEYHRVFSCGLFSPDQRGWLCSNRLEGSVKCLGWYHDSHRGAIIMEHAGDQCLSMRHSSYDFNLIKPKYYRAGQLIAMLHEKNIFHADLKPNNFVTPCPNDVSDTVVLIDCDDVRFPSRLSVARRVKNLAQFWGGLSYAIVDVEHRRLIADEAKRGYCHQTGRDIFLEEKWHVLFNAFVEEIYTRFVKEYQEIENVIWT